MEEPSMIFLIEIGNALGYGTLVRTLFVAPQFQDIANDDDRSI